MKNLKMILSLTALNLTACGSVELPSISENISQKVSVASESETYATPSAALNVVDLPAVNPSSPTNIALTYYKKTITAAPINGFITKTYTATGSCVTYQSKNYCWDDGIKTIQFTYSNVQYGPYTYTYFGMGLNATGTPWSQCYGACKADLMSSPTEMTTRLINAMAQPTAMSQVFSTGTPVQVNCSEADGILNCVDFAINLNQSPL